MEEGVLGQEQKGGQEAVGRRIGHWARTGRCRARRGIPGMGGVPMGWEACHLGTWCSN